MKIFVLIVWISSGFGEAITTHEFYGKEACEQAGHEFKKKRGYGNYLCIPKGETGL